MLQVRGMTVEEVRESHQREIEARCLIAFAAGCRLAVSELNAPAADQPFDMSSILFGSPPPGVVTLTWDFVVLSPGEKPPAGCRWTIYEDRSGTPIGRQA